MTSIQQLKEHVIRLNDERLLNQFDIYNNFNFRDTKEIIYYKIIEYELHRRRLLEHKIMEDNYEYEHAQ